MHWLLPRLSSLLLCALSPAMPMFAAAAPSAAPPTVPVPQCSKVTLSASYLAQVSAGGGPGFLLTIANDTDAAITLAQPFPTSAHWYALAPNGRWSWRASSGAGGGLVDALRERGPVLAYRSPASTEPPSIFTVAPHKHLERAEAIRDNAALRFRPGCERCRNPEDKQYRAILAYAYLPPSTRPAGLLTCGLRSNLVVMPPLE